ncbi:hypothetical protein CC86DRAFT_161650 [Ophiobolus disseminans]|uniref:Uncharacterized protein n=1 Tax=Ophiobolus disseminans TaxID=1469910 RepID=A0A6A7ACM7_9PLEO|nr:hypothetical protein CC86DRAFT_161650 [Ophiobolus disseminans]
MWWSPTKPFVFTQLAGCFRTHSVNLKRNDHQSTSRCSTAYSYVKIACNAGPTRHAALRKRSATPPEKITSSDEVMFAEQEERAAKRAECDIDYQERSSTKSLSD